MRFDRSNAATAATGAPLTEQPDHDGRVLTAREQRRLQTSEATEINHAILDRLVGLETVAAALQQLVGLQTRRILWSGSALLNANGVWHRRLPGAPARAIYVVNAGAAAIVVSADGPGPAAPGPGAGTHTVPAASALGINAETTNWTIYGAANQIVSVQIFGVPITPTAAGAL